MENNALTGSKANSGVLEPQDPTVLHKRSFYIAYGKRLLDIALVLLAAPVLLPIVVFLILLILVLDGQPFYSQARLGLNERQFRIWKFRTMVPDADRKLQSYLEKNPALREEWDTLQKLTNDPRITRVGRLLRKTSLDELPQLWNVLVGDMSLVGPRPMMVDQHSLYPGLAYYRMRPGITGPWQVSDRNSVSFACRAGFDAEYERKLSFLYDCQLIAMTARVVLKATGK